MGWFAVDDGFDNHPKIRKAGNAAAGLFCRLGAYSSRSATEGVVPGPVARDYGTAAQLKKLGELGMIHTAGHDCKDCVQPPPGDFVMHDYLDYNRSRREIENARKAGAERQRKRRERLAAEAAAALSDGKTATPTGVSGGVSPGVAGETPGGVAGETPVSNSNRRSGAPVTADGAEERARQSPPLPTTAPNGAVASKLGGTPQHGPVIPDFAVDLVAGLTNAGLIVSWGLGESEWFAIHALIKRTNVPALIDFTRTRWNPADPPKTARYLMRMWADIPSITNLPAPAVPSDNVVPFQPGRSLPLTGTDANVAGHAALIAQLAQEHNT